MCVTCGCSDLTMHQHVHDPAQHHGHQQQTAVINLETEILSENSRFARHNREWFQQNQALALNLLSSPGSGKTTLLESVIQQLLPDYPLLVIEGDQHTALDAERIQAAGAHAYQINTGKNCHLDGHMVSHALEHLELERGGFVFIENVGNLICPALFDLGEQLRVVIIAVTEGADKPLKYPDMFRSADLIIINKIDLLAYVRFDIGACEENIRKINARAKIMRLSATQEGGTVELVKWLTSAHRHYLS